MSDLLLLSILPDVTVASLLRLLGHISLIYVISVASCASVWQEHTAGRCVTLSEFGLGFSDSGVEDKLCVPACSGSSSTATLHSCASTSQVGFCQCTFLSWYSRTSAHCMPVQAVGKTSCMCPSLYFGVGVDLAKSSRSSVKIVPSLIFCRGFVGRSATLALPFHSS